MENYIKEQEEKAKLKAKIELYTKKLENIIKSDDKALYSKLIGCLNETFYGYNRTQLKEYFEQNDIGVNGSVINNFNIRHLEMQKYLIIKLGVYIEQKRPQTTQEYYKLAYKSGDLAKKYFVDTYDEQPLNDLMKAQNQQMRIENLTFATKSTTEKSKLCGTKTLEVKGLKTEKNETKQEELVTLKELKKDIAEGLSRIGTIRNPQGAANSLYSELIAKIYKTKGVKQAKDLKEKLEDSLNIEINSLEELLPTSDLIEINNVLLSLNNYIKSKEGISNRQTVSNIYERNHDLAHIASKRIMNRLKEKNSEAKRITPYMELKKHIKSMK